MASVIPPPVSETELDHRFDYHPLQPGQAERYTAIRQGCRQLAGLIASICPNCRESNLALTNLESVMFNANAAVARHPLALPQHVAEEDSGPHPQFPHLSKAP